MLLNRDSIIFRVFLFRVILLEDSAQISSKSKRIPCIRPNDVMFCLDAQLSKHHPSGWRELSVWTFLCVEKLRTTPGGRLSNTAGRLSMFDKEKRFRSKTQIWENSCNRLDDVCSRPDAILDKASHAYKVQPSKRQSPWSGRASLNMEIVCRRSSTFRTSVSMVRTLKP
jgi:hypothetical protein